MKGNIFRKKDGVLLPGGSWGGGGGVLGNGFIYMEISMKGKVFTKRGWGLGVFLGDRFIYMERYGGKSF